MTLINSCCPKSFSHLILLFSTFAITATTVPTDRLYQLEASAGDPVRAVSDYDRKNDNKRYDNLFDFKTDINNLLLHSHGNLQPSTITRKRRDTIVSTMETTSSSSTTSEISTSTKATSLSTENLILNLSLANLTSFNLNFSSAISERVAMLNLSHNFLSKFNASKLTKLKALDLSHNNFNEIILQGHKLLRSLNVSENSLTTFRCDNCESLEILKLSNNNLKNITLDNASNLRLVDLSANELSVIDRNLFQNKSNLSDVILACNRIVLIDKDLFLSLPSLTRLDLSYNDISDIAIETFSHLSNLQIFDLSFNRIHIASLQSLQSIDDLARLSLAGNSLLRNALRGFAVTWSIMELDYSHVGLCQVPDSLAQSVRILNLYGNFLNIICSGDFDSYPLLHKLVLSNNNLTSIEDDALGRLDMLKMLYLEGNQLTQIPASLPPSLTRLNIQNNRITDIKVVDLINLINLRVLDVSGNKIIYIPQLSLPALITLSVKSCGLENIHRQISRTCPKLRHLVINGNPIKCSELLEVEQCNENSFALTNEHINDDIDYQSNDAELRLNSPSYFPNDGGLNKCEQGRTKNQERTHAIPNCWNEHKLITSFNLTNDFTSAASTVTSLTTPSTNDNKFKHDVKKGSSRGRNDGNLSNETMRMNNNTTMDEKITVEQQAKQAKAHNWQSGMMPVKSENMKNSKATAELKPKLMKEEEKLVFPVNVVKSEEIAKLNNNGKSVSVDKNLSLESGDALRQKGLNNSILMKTKQIKTTQNPASANSRKTNPSDHGVNGNPTSAVINRNLIDYVNGDYRRAQSSDKIISANKIKAIKDNESSTSANKSKSIDEVAAVYWKDNKSKTLPEANTSGNEGIDATDHQQHMPINQSMNEKWNDIRSESINHPGLLIVVAISVGVLFTFIVVYVYRCNFINSARRRRRRGSCETINEGRDVLNDNFNEETHSFTIESHNHSHCSSPLTAVNQSDLLPMDILNSALNQQTTAPHISMHLW